MTENHIPRRKALGKNIARYRKFRGYTQKELADVLGVSRSYIARVETASCTVSAEMLFTLSDALKVKVNKFFEGV